MRLTAMVMFWMLFQIAGITPSLTPLALNHIATEEVCTCPDAVPGGMCPMHHQPESKPDALSRAYAPDSPPPRA